MADMFTSQERSEIMSKVHSANTKPEICVRKILHKLGYRFRLQRKDLPGNPDIVLSKYKTVIFVHGCFWHGCPTCRRAQIRPQTNQDYWNRKLDRTLERDKETLIALHNLGWRVLIVWECETKKKNLLTLEQKLKDFLSTI